MRCDTFMRVSGGERAEWYLINEIRIEVARRGLYAATASHSRTIVVHEEKVHDPGILDFTATQTGMNYELRLSDNTLGNMSTHELNFELVI